jgi:hypothetical protein
VGNRHRAFSDRRDSELADRRAAAFARGDEPGMKLILATLAFLALLAAIFSLYVKAGAIVDLANHWFFC